MGFWETAYTYLGNPEKGKMLDAWDEERFKKMEEKRKKQKLNQKKNKR